MEDSLKGAEALLMIGQYEEALQACTAELEELRDEIVKSTRQKKDSPHRDTGTASHLACRFRLLVSFPPLMFFRQGKAEGTRS